MITLNGLSLSIHLQWIDEFSSTERVAQFATRTLGGVLVLQSQSLQLGRPITLQSTDNTGWLLRPDVVQLQTFSETAGLTMPLVIGSQSFNVRFRHYDDPAFEAIPLADLYIVDGLSTQYYTVTIKLITV